MKCGFIIIRQKQKISQKCGILIDYLQKGKTITEEYYASLLDRFDAILKGQRLRLAKKQVLFYHDNAPVHTSAIATAKLFTHATQHFLIHLIPQIWLLPIIFCSLTWKLGLEVKDFHRTKRSLLRQMTKVLLDTLNIHIYKCEKFWLQINPHRVFVFYILIMDEKVLVLCEK